MSSVAVLGLPGTGALASHPAALAHCDLIRFLGEENTGKLGRLYCARYPAEAEVENLARSLRTTLTAGTDTFADVIAEDFAAGNTVHLDGWVLSRTEARQAALYSILNS